MSKFKTLIFLIPIIVSVSCKKNECDTQIVLQPDQLKSLDINRLEVKLQESSGVDDVTNVLKKNRSVSNAFFDAQQYPRMEILGKRIYHLYQNPNIDTLLNEVEAEYGQLESVEEQLAEAFSKIKVLFPSFQIPRIYTTVSGFYRDMFVSDSLLVIGLDYFLPMSASYKPHLNQVPKYIQERYNKEHLPAVVMAYYSGLFTNVDPKDKTLLAEMIDYGKSIYLRKKLLSCTPEHIIMGYPEDILEDVEKNEITIWAHFVNNNLIYETTHRIKTKYIGERPKIQEIGDKCPGRIGRWLGLQIVESYADTHPDLSIQEIMHYNDYRKMFMESGYNPL